MCLWNTDTPGSNKVKICQNNVSPALRPIPPPGACDISEVWATLRWIYSPRLVHVTVSAPKLYLLRFLCKQDRIKDKWLDKRLTGDPITRCSWQTFHWGRGDKKKKLVEVWITLQYDGQLNVHWLLYGVIPWVSYFMVPRKNVQW